MLDEMHLTDIMCVFSQSVMSDSLQPHELYSTRLLCLWSFLGKNTGASGCILLQGFSPSRDQTLSSRASCIGGRFFTTAPPGAATDIWRTFHIVAAEYTYFSSIQRTFSVGTFSRIDNVVDHKSSQCI